MWTTTTNKQFGNSKTIVNETVLQTSWEVESGTGSLAGYGLVMSVMLVGPISMLVKEVFPRSVMQLLPSAPSVSDSTIVAKSEKY